MTAEILLLVYHYLSLQFLQLTLTESHPSFVSETPTKKLSACPSALLYK